MKKSSSQTKHLIISILASALATLIITGCSGADDSQASSQSDLYDRISEEAQRLHPYIPVNNTEFNNFNESQKLYDNPTTIIWCTAFPASPTSSMFTVPIAGKLTSSTTTFFSPDLVDSSNDGKVAIQARSVDKMYHPNPPGYRYGFTPGGQYIDFYNIPTFCTTKPMKFQTKNIKFEVVDSLDNATQKAQQALKEGNNALSQKILEKAANNYGK